MAEGGLVPSHVVDPRSNGYRTATRALQAGLVALFCLFVLLATFGPWFNLAVAYSLATAAIVAGGLGLGWAHAASHRLRRRGSRAAARTARLGGLASAIALAVSAYLSGLSLFLLQPLVLAVSLSLLVVFLTLHFGAIRAEGRASP